MAHDLILVEADGRCQSPVHRECKGDTAGEGTESANDSEGPCARGEAFR